MVNGAHSVNGTRDDESRANSSAPTSPSSVDVSLDADGECGFDVATNGDERRVTASWTPLSTGKSKGGAWSHEVRVRLPARLKASHHIVLSVYGRDAEVGGVMGTLMGSKGGAEAPLGHAILPSRRLKRRSPRRLPRRWVSGRGVGVGGGREVSLPAVTELLPKYLQSNVRAHMRYWEDRNRASTSAYERRAPTSTPRMKRLARRTPPCRRRRGGHQAPRRGTRRDEGRWREWTTPRGAWRASAGTASTRSNVARGGRFGLSAGEPAGRGGPELLRHLPAVMHLLLSLVAAPPASVAQAVAADAAEAAAARRRGGGGRGQRG